MILVAGEEIKPTTIRLGDLIKIGSMNKRIKLI
jgi:hypothetical protein